MANITNSINKFSLLNYQSQDNSLFGKSNKAKNFLQTQRKLNPELDASLYALDLSKAISDTSKTDELAKKVARGEKLTNEEKAFMEKTDPEKLIKNEDFNKFLSTLNGRLPSPSGDIVKKPNIKFGSDKNAAYREIQSSGWLSDPQYAAAIQYDGIYVEVPVMRQVLNNQQTRERANLEEFQYTKMGSKLNAAYRGDNEELIYGQ